MKSILSDALNIASERLSVKIQKGDIPHNAVSIASEN